MKTIINQTVLDYYRAKTKEELPESVLEIYEVQDPLCIAVNEGEYYVRLTWSSEYCEFKKSVFFDYEVYDEHFQDIDGGLFAVPEKTSNLVDALKYACKHERDFSYLTGDWAFIDEEAISDANMTVFAMMKKAI